MKKLTLSHVLALVAIVLFLAAAATVDGHLGVGNTFVLAFVGLAASTASRAAHDEGR